jgi:hypothetical protein
MVNGGLRIHRSESLVESIAHGQEVAEPWGRSFSHKRKSISDVERRRACSLRMTDQASKLMGLLVHYSSGRATSGRARPAWRERSGPASAKASALQADASSQPDRLPGKQAAWGLPDRRARGARSGERTACALGGHVAGITRCPVGIFGRSPKPPAMPPTHPAERAIPAGIHPGDREGAFPPRSPLEAILPLACTSRRIPGSVRISSPVSESQGSKRVLERLCPRA